MATTPTPPPSNGLGKYKWVTHYAAIVIAGVVAFAVTPAGEALIKQYPHLTGVVTLATMLATLYHIPLKGD